MDANDHWIVWSKPCYLQIVGISNQKKQKTNIRDMKVAYIFMKMIVFKKKIIGLSKCCFLCDEDVDVK